MALTVDDPRDAPVYGIAAHVLGMGALLGYWCESGRLEPDDRLARLFADHLSHGRRRAELGFNRLLQVAGACRDRGVEPIIVKGAYTSRVYFPDPGTRPFADLDLLVEPGAFAAARQALSDCGLVETERSAGESSWRHDTRPVVVHSLEMDRADDPWNVDLHSTLDRRYFWRRWSRFGGLPFLQAAPWDIDGAPARRLTQPLLTVHLAQHAVWDHEAIRLIRLVELIEVVRRDVGNGTLSWEGLASLLADTAGEVLAYPAFSLCDRICPGVIDPQFLNELGRFATRRQRRVIALWLEAGVGVSGRGTWDERLMWSHTPSEHVYNLLHTVARRMVRRWSPVSTQRLRSVVGRWCDRLRPRS